MYPSVSKRTHMIESMHTRHASKHTFEYTYLSKNILCGTEVKVEFFADGTPFVCFFDSQYCFVDQRKLGKN